MFFKCQITDPPFSRDIRFGYNELSTIESIKNKIVFVLRIGISQFDIDNPPSEQQIKSNLNGYELKISIKNRCKDVKFNMPDGKQFTIPNCYRMKFIDVVKFFNQKGYDYNFQFFISGKETLRIPFPFFAVPTDSVVNVQKKGDNYAQSNQKIQGNTVTLNFDNKTFNFPENTFVGDAYNKILETYKKDTKINLISIINTNNHQRIMGGIQLKSTEKYLVSIMCPYSFKNKADSSYKSYQHFDFFAKVLDAKQRLAPQLSIKMTVKPKNVVIYDKNGSEVKDDGLFLRDIHNFEGDIYFDIVKKASKSDKKSTKQNEKNQTQSINTKLDSDESEQKSKKKSIVPQKDEIKEKQPEKQSNESNLKESLSKSENQKEKQSDESSAQESLSKSEKKTSQKASFSRSQLMKSLKINPLSKQQSMNSDEKDRNSAAQKTKNQDHPSSKRDSDSDENLDTDSAKDQIQSKLKSESDSEESKPKSETKSIEIKFMFDESSEEKFDPYSEKVSVDKTIEELEEEISNKYDIDKKIVIGYKSGKNLFEIDYDMNIEDVIDDIKTETNSGETENVLYIKITQKPKKAKSTRPMKPKPIIQPTADKPKPTKQEPEPSKPKQDKQQNPKQISAQKPKSKKKQETESDDDSEDDFVEPVKKPKNIKDEVTKKKKNQYHFTYKDKEKKLTLDPEPSLEDNEEEIKEKFGIKEEEKIEFFVSDPDEEDEGEDESKIDHERKMKTLKNFTIEIQVIKNKKKETKDKKETKGTKEKYKYYYQTNQDDEIKEIELEEGTKVKEFKKEICRLNEVDNLANIKVIFAGKDLLNDIVLDELNVGDTVLYIYIRSIQDILLMTAKALQFNKDDFEEEEEEESESEDDD